MAERWNQIPECDKEPLRALIAEIKGMGYTSVQWGDHGVVLGRKPYTTAFFEAFGKAFMRGEGKTVLESAQQALSIMKKQDACSHPADAWKYTHNNGFKTCGICGYFAPCTPEEALAHYDHGSVKAQGGRSYFTFDNRRPLCPKCGGRVLEHDYAFDVEQCHSCGQLLEKAKDATDDEPLRVLFGDTPPDPEYHLIDAKPPAVGLWHSEKGLWLGEGGHIETFRMSEIERWQVNIDYYLQDAKLELRMVNPDLTPGDVVPFHFDKEAYYSKYFAGLGATTGEAEKNG